MSSRRVLASAAVLALLAPWLMVLLAAAHVALDHHGEPAADHLAGRVEAAWHGHEHDSEAVPHQHEAAPPEGKAAQSGGPPSPLAASLLSEASRARTAAWTSTLKRDPPDPPAASPPILRV